MILAHKNGSIEIVSLVTANSTSATVIGVGEDAKPKKVLNTDLSRQIFNGSNASGRAIDWIKKVNQNESN